MLRNLIINLTVIFGLLALSSITLLSQSTCNCTPQLQMIFDDCIPQDIETEIGFYIYNSDINNISSSNWVKVFANDSIVFNGAVNLSDKGFYSNTFMYKPTKDVNYYFEFHCLKDKCLADKSFSQKTMPSFELISKDVSCFGASNGEVKLDNLVFSGDLEVKWESGDRKNLVESMHSGTYHVTVENSNGCQEERSIKIEEPAELKVDPKFLTIEDNGQIVHCMKAEVSGGEPSYLYGWDQNGIGQMSGNNHIICEEDGVHKVMVMDKNGCTAEKVMKFEEGNPFVIETQNGSIKAHEDMGDGRYKYDLTKALNPEYGDIDGDKSAGSIFNTTFYENGNIISKPEEFISDAESVVDVEFSNELIGQRSVSLALSSGFFFLRNNASVACNYFDPIVIDGFTQPNNPLPPGGVFKVFERATLVEYSSQVLNFNSTTNVWTWNPNFSPPAPSPLRYILYYINGTDTLQSQLNVVSTSGSVDVLVNDVCGNGGLVQILCSPIDGSLSGSGLEPFTFLPPNSDQIIYFIDPSKLTPGNTFRYTYTIPGSTGTMANLRCAAVISDDLNVLPFPSIEINTFVSQVCVKESINLSTTATLTSGTQTNLNYQWFFRANNVTTPILGANSAQLLISDSEISGQYIVRVSQSNGCAARDTGFVEVIELPKVTSEVLSDITCFGVSSAQVNLSIDNVTDYSLYTFNWIGKNTGTVLNGRSQSNLPADSFRIIVTTPPLNAAGLQCSLVDTIVIKSYPEIGINCSPIDTSVACFGDMNLSRTVSVSSLATGPFSYSLTSKNGPWQDSPTFTGLGVGNNPAILSRDYKVFVRDGNSCVDSCLFAINQPTRLSCSISNTNLSCFNSGDGRVTVNPVGGVSPYSYLWSNGATNQSLTSLMAGSYSVVVTDANNCTSSCNVTVNQPTEINLNLVNQNICLDFDTQLSSLPTGGVGGYQYMWSLSNGPGTTQSGATDANIINGITDQSTIDFSTFCLKPGNIVLLNRVTDSNGCIKVDSVIINAQPCFDLAIRKKKAEDKLYYVGDVIEYEIEVFNQGTVDALNVTVKDEFDTALLFDPSQNLTSDTDNENDWSLVAGNLNLIQTTISEIKAGTSVVLVVFFTIDPATTKLNIVNNTYTDDYQSRIDAARVKDNPIDEDDTNHFEDNDFSNEIDDEVCDSENQLGLCNEPDKPNDEDRFDFDVLVLCNLAGNVVERNFCIDQSQVVNGWNINTPEFRAALDPDGDGDGLTNDGDLGNEIMSFHASYLDALNNVDPLPNTVPIASYINVYGRLVGQNGCINASRLSARVTIQPTITTQPSSTSVMLDEDNVCLSAATTILNPRFQWKVKVGNTYQDIPNATSNIYCLPRITQDMNRSTYKVEVSDANGSDPSCSRLSTEAIIAIESDLKLVCKSLVNVSLDGNCLALITPAMILEGARSFANARVEITTSTGLLVPNPITSAYVGQTLTVTVFDVTNGNSCWSNIKIEDKLGPVITCPVDYTVSCANFDFVPPVPVFSDACDGSATIRLVSERFVELDCNRLDNLIAYKEYTYQAKDKQGNLSPLCTFRVNYQNINIASVTMPANVELECNNSGTVASWDTNGNGKPDPLEIGVPKSGLFDLLNPSNTSSNGLSSQGYCKVNITFNDSRIDLCGNTYKIVREWIIIEWCSGNVRNHFQTIKVEDTTPPTFTCMTNGVTVNTNQHRCTADYQIPTPSAVRDCNSTTWNVSLADPKTIVNNDPATAQYSKENIVQDPTSKVYFAQYLPLGISWIRFEMSDECGNTSYCYMPVNVVDTETPTPVCDEFTVVSLDDKGRARLYATTVDDGSHDNCSKVRFGVRRMNNACSIAADSKIIANVNGINYYSFVDFCCSDQVNNKQLVEMIVLDESDNYNFCMTNVEIQQKTLPKLTCPADVTVDCEQSTSPTALSSFATFTSGCPIYYITFVDSETELTCGEKNIIRTWEVRENITNTSVVSCVQRVFVRNLTPFNFNTVVFPDNVTLVNKCNAAKDFGPTNPATGGYPTWTNIGCSQVGASYIDQVFENVPDACFKIIRNWSVIDWCTFDVNKPATIRNHQQIIKVIDTEKPTPICDEMIFFVNQSCNSEVRITGRAIDSCTPEDKMTYSYRLDLDGDGTYATSKKGRILSENITVGTHAVEWTVEDQCGNTGTCVQRVIVRDTIKPTPYCLSSITTVLMPSTLSVAIWAKDYNIGATDNCTKKLKFTFGANPPVDTNIKHFYKPSGNGSVIATEAEYNAGLAESWDPVLCTSGKVYDCDQLGLRDIVIYVHDDSGNYDFCTVKIKIQDNTGNCGLSRLAKADGIISTPKGELMEHVEVTFQHTNSTEIISDITNTTGEYLKTGLVGDRDYAVSAGKTDDYLNGVSTLDLVMIQRHILGIEKISDPLLLLAADINNDKRITAGDLSDLRKVILGVTTAFSNNTAWRFVPKTAVVPSALPFDLPSRAFFTTINDTKFTNDFYGVKVGDISSDAKANINSAVANTRSKAISLFTSEALVKANIDTKVAIKSSDLLDINGIQLAITLHSDATIVEIIPSSLAITPAHYHVRNLGDQQLVNISWSANEAVHIGKNDVLFEVVVRTNRTLQSSQLMHLEAGDAYNEVILSDLSVRDVNLSARSIASDLANGKLKVYQNIPNPFSEFTTIKYFLPEDGKVTLTIVDMRGNLILERTEGKTKGENELQLSNSTLLNSRGVLFATVRTETETQTIKMIMME